MQLRVLGLLTAAVAVVAIPASSTFSQSQHPGAHVAVTSLKPAAHVDAKKKKPTIKSFKMIDINIDECSCCFTAVTNTIGSCEPILDGWTGWFHIPDCIKQIENDFSALTNDCIPCLKSFAG